MAEVEILTDKGKAPNREGQKEIAAALNLIAQKIDAKTQIDTGDMNSVVLACIDGTAPGFKRAMKLYFQLHKVTNTVADDGTVTYPAAAAITDCTNGFYKLLQDNFEWDGGTKFYDPSVSSSPFGTRFGDNKDMSCTPSTTTAANRDDYAGLPLFAIIDCNWTIDSTTLKAQITAIDGVVGNFKRYDAGTYVGVLQMTGYHYYTNPGAASNQEYIEGYRIGNDPTKPNCTPLPEAVLPDGTVRPWVIHGKYAAGLTNGLFTCCSGVAEARGQSHNSSIAYSHKAGTGYSGMCACDLGFLQLMMRIKYASLTADGILDHAKAYYNTTTAVVAETGVKRIIIDAAQKNNYIVGSSILVGTAKSTDPQVADTYSISGSDGWVITAVEDVTINGTKYAAVYVDASNTFDTLAGDTADTKTSIRTYLWRTGSTDDVLGNDGAIDPTASKYPVKLQGIEWGLGAYEVCGDTILKLYQDATDTTKYWYEPYTCKTASKQSTSLTDDYQASGAKFDQSLPEAYIKSMQWGKDGVCFPLETNGSSSTYTRDFFWHNKNTVDTREWIAFSTLGDGALAGLSCLNGSYWLGAAWWHDAARLSPNGNRG